MSTNVDNQVSRSTRNKFFLILILFTFMYAPSSFSMSLIKNCADFLFGKFTPQTETLAEDAASTVSINTITANKATYNSTTSVVIGYLGDLLEHHIIGDKELTLLIVGLSQGKLVNPITEEDAQLSGSLFIHRDGLESLLHEPDLDFEKLSDWAKAELKNKAEVQVKREQVKVETQIIHQKIEFGTIKAGTFTQGEGDKTRQTTISKDFELMRHDFTQRQASKLLGFNPAHFFDGPDTITEVIHGTEVKMQPNNPVENIHQIENSTDLEYSRYSVYHILKKLNDLAKNADQGDQSAQTLILDLIPDYQRGDRFDLPTEGQLALALFKHGDMDKAKLQKHAYYAANSGNSTHPVDEVRPVMIDGTPFFGLKGNVWKMTKDGHADLKETKARDPYVHPSSGSERVALGGSWSSLAEGLHSSFRRPVHPGFRFYDVGVRFVRIRNP